MKPIKETVGGHQDINTQRSERNPTFSSQQLKNWTFLHWRWVRLFLFVVALIKGKFLSLCDGKLSFTHTLFISWGKGLSQHVDRWLFQTDSRRTFPLRYLRIAVSAFSHIHWVMTEHTDMMNIFLDSMWLTNICSYYLTQHCWGVCFVLVCPHRSSCSTKDVITETKMVSEIKSNKFYLYTPKSQAHCLNGLYNLYSERHPLPLDPWFDWGQTCQCYGYRKLNASRAPSVHHWDHK